MTDATTQNTSYSEIDDGGCVGTARSLESDAHSSSSPVTVGTTPLLFSSSQEQNWEEVPQHLAQIQLSSTADIASFCEINRDEEEDEEGDRTEVFATPSTRDESLLASPATNDVVCTQPSKPGHPRHYLGPHADSR